MVKLDRRQFFSLLVHIACYRRNPPTKAQQANKEEKAEPSTHTTCKACFHRRLLSSFTTNKKHAFASVRPQVE